MVPRALTGRETGPASVGKGLPAWSVLRAARGTLAGGGQVAASLVGSLGCGASVFLTAWLAESFESSISQPAAGSRQEPGLEAEPLPAAEPEQRAGPSVLCERPPHPWEALLGSTAWAPLAGMSPCFSVVPCKAFSLSCPRDPRAAPRRHPHLLPSWQPAWILLSSVPVLLGGLKVMGRAVCIGNSVSGYEQIQMGCVFPG